MRSGIRSDRLTLTDRLSETVSFLPQVKLCSSDEFEAPEPRLHLTTHISRLSCLDPPFAMAVMSAPTPNLTAVPALDHPKAAESIDSANKPVIVKHSNASPAIEQRMLNVIATATAHGSWGETCFLVESKADGNAYACVYASLDLLRASNAGELLDHVEKHGCPTLDAALKALLGNKTAPPVQTNNGDNKGILRNPQSFPTGGVRYVPVSNIAVTTLRAVIMFLQTGHIAFAPRSSKLIEDDSSASNYEGPALVSAEGAKVQWPLSMQASAKSIYHAACRFGLNDLRELAEKTIESQVDASNILADLFSRFTLNHPDLRTKRLEFAISHWDDIKKHHRTGFADALFSHADRPGAKDVIDQILQRTSIAAADGQ